MIFPISANTRHCCSDKFSHTHTEMFTRQLIREELTSQQHRSLTVSAQLGTCVPNTQTVTVQGRRVGFLPRDARN